VAPEVETSIADRLRSMGQRLTPKRRALVDVMTRARHPMTIGEILAQDASLALSSAYRNLTVLEHAGVVRRVVTDEDYARFELAEDLTEHHHHLICEACGLVEDFEVRLELERAVDAELASIARRRGFAVRSHRIDVIGLCPACAAKSERPRRGETPGRSNGGSRSSRAR
jgi:Fe2+ or Zn2+ uptake regulation protein